MFTGITCPVIAVAKTAEDHPGLRTDVKQKILKSKACSITSFYYQALLA